MIDVFINYEFMQRALIAGILIAFSASYYGVFVVQRGLSFLGDGLAHAAFGGVALALMLHQEPLWIAIPFTVAVAVLITWVRNRSGLASDTVIGIFFALSMALGIIFLSRSQGYQSDAFTYLFGSILGVSAFDVKASIVMAVCTILTIPLWGRWAYETIDREASMVDRLPVVFDDYLLSILIALTIVISAKIIGIVLISAFLVIPAAASRLVNRRFLLMTVISIIFGIMSVIAGLWISYGADLPSGPVIIITQTVIFMVCLLVSQLYNSYQNRERQ